MRILALLLLTLVLVTCSSSTDEVLDIRGGITGPRFGDNDPHDWINDSQGRKPWNYPVHGIDVAKYQGDIDWAAVKRAGISFVFMKATEGGDRVDERFAEYWRATRRAGIPRSAYHFYYFCRPAFEQAKWYISNVPKERGSLPPVLDMEWNHKSPSCKFRPEPVAVRREMGVFLSMLKRHYGKAPIIYTTVDFYRENELWKIKNHDFWLRSVAAHPSAIYPDQTWRFWQYTGTGQMPGIVGDTDINVFSGSPTEWRNWVKANSIE
jgi:lysozyme